MAGSEERESLWSALRDRTRVVSTELTGSLPRGLRLAAAYSWRLLVIAAAAGVVIWLVIQLKLLVVPLLIAILVTALLWPFLSWMLRHRVPRGLAIVIAVVTTLAVVSGLLWVVVWQITREFGRVQARTVDAVAAFRQYLIDGPLHLSAGQIDDLLNQGGSLVQGALGTFDSLNPLIVKGVPAISLRGRA